MRLSSHGIDVDVPQGWDGEIYRRSPGLQAQGVDGEATHPIVHLSNFPLPHTRGDYGSEATEIMKAGDLFIVLFEFGDSSVGKALFSSEGIPTVNADDFAPHTMHHPREGLSGVQYFFTDAGRAFCLYVVLGGHVRRNELVPEVNHILATLDLESLA